jgi:hypothetical protein
MVRINALLLDALASLGVPASWRCRRSARECPRRLPCFAEPAKGEIVVG